MNDRADPKPTPTGAPMPCIFDRLPPGPLDMAQVEEEMELDVQRHSLAALDRALARIRPATADPMDAGAD